MREVSHIEDSPFLYPSYADPAAADEITGQTLAEWNYLAAAFFYAVETKTQR